MLCWPTILEMLQLNTRAGQITSAGAFTTLKNPQSKIECGSAAIDASLAVVSRGLRIQQAAREFGNVLHPEEQ
jgi:hypothetical protein